MPNPSSPDERRDAVIEAVLYALRCGCLFHGVEDPQSPYSVPKLIKWGAMRNLHTKIAELNREARAD